MAKDNEINFLKKILEEINKALDDNNITEIQDKQLNEVLIGGTSATAGAILSGTALYFAGTTGISAAGITSGLAFAGSLIGGGMAAGIAVLASPVAILGIAGVVVASKINKKRIRQTETLFFKESLEKLAKLYKKIEHTSKEDKKRIRYLMQLALVLKRYTQELMKKLGTEEDKILYQPLLDKELKLNDDDIDNSQDEQ